LVILADVIGRCIVGGWGLQGIKFLQENRIIGESPTEVADYLLKGELLNKKSIGDFIGEQ